MSDAGSDAGSAAPEIVQDEVADVTPAKGGSMSVEDALQEVLKVGFSRIFPIGKFWLRGLREKS